MRAHILRVLSKPNSTNAGSSGGPSLNLDHNFAAQFLGGCDCFLGTRGGATARNLEAVSSENGLTLILVKSRHGCVLFRMKMPNVQRQHPTRKAELSVQSWALSVRVCIDNSEVAYPPTAW